MTPLQMQTAFEIEVGSIDSTIKPLTTDVFYWLNQAVNKFVKTRYSGLNYKKESFEQTQKRTDDLRSLIKESTIVPSSGTNKPNSYIATIPTDYLFTVGEEVTISFVKNSITYTSREGITEITDDRYRQEMDNIYSEFRLLYNWARPLRLYYSTYVELVTDGTYNITNYYLRYISQPTAISLSSANLTLPEHTHTEIVKLAVGMYLENIKDSRYQNYDREISTME